MVSKKIWKIYCFQDSFHKQAGEFGSEEEGSHGILVTSALNFSDPIKLSFGYRSEMILFLSQQHICVNLNLKLQLQSKTDFDN